LVHFWKGLRRHTWIASKHCNLDWNKEDAADVLGGIDDKTLVWPYSTRSAVAHLFLKLTILVIVNKAIRRTEIGRDTADLNKAATTTSTK
jgi:hypothetical protein